MEDNLTAATYNEHSLIPDFNDEITAIDSEIIDSLVTVDLNDVIVYSRDWTVETIVSQINQGNIELNPKFQRRNAWSDLRRSMLIESLIVGYPVPEIVLAEDSKQKKLFVVIDGKQRLLTIAGFVNHAKYGYWNKDKLTGLNVRDNLNGLTYSELSTEEKYAKEFRQFNNAALRCTILSNYSSDDILYDIFYRLNTGSVPLSTQELRNVIKRGPFTNYLLEITSANHPIHYVLGLSGPDNRLRDVEISLRCISIMMFASDYQGNLKVFLDKVMEKLNGSWVTLEKNVKACDTRFCNSIKRLKLVLGDYKLLGRRIAASSYDRRFNRALFEVQVFYFDLIDDGVLVEDTMARFVAEFTLLSESPEFLRTIEATTKSLDNYRIRFELFRKIMNKSFSLDIISNPFERNNGN